MANPNKTLRFNDLTDNIKITATTLRSREDLSLNIETSNNLVIDASNFKLNNNNLQVNLGSSQGDVTFSSAHNLESGDIILLDNVTVPSGIGLTDAAFEDKLFQVTRVTSSLIAIVTGSQTTTGAAGGGSCVACTGRGGSSKR